MGDMLLEAVEKTAGLIAGAKRIVVFTGAGASTESGIPDFRSPGGIWSRFDPEEFTIYRFLASAETRLKQWKILIESGLIVNAKPNQAHLAVAELEKLGKLDCVITQNIDNLHQKAGNTPEKVFELHGTMNYARCLGCQNRYSMEDLLGRCNLDDEAPLCPECFGILKPDVIFFGEQLPAEALRQAVAERLPVPASIPPFFLCTDNAAMIGAAAHYRLLSDGPTALDFDVEPDLALRVV